MDTTGLFDLPGPRTRRRIHIATAAALVVLAGLVALLLIRLEGRGQLEPERWAILFDPATGVPGTLLDALRSTLEAALLGMVLSLAVGTLLAVGHGCPRSDSYAGPRRSSCSSSAEFRCC